jgi:hypothetical protein
MYCHSERDALTEKWRIKFTGEAAHSMHVLPNPVMWSSASHHLTFRSHYWKEGGLFHTSDYSSSSFRIQIRPSLDFMAQN